ncbi:ABC transporter substrate-binding protein [Bradyrhizobium sp. CCBAU 53340]|nr:ABC transporter substrate-binding protein [Bradyrhizobium sp. CCBAU 53340]
MGSKLNRNADSMTRRKVVTGLALAVVWPWTCHAQQAAKAKIIGFLGASSAETAGPWIAAFVKRLGELGWTEGKNVTIEYRWAEANTERYSEIAAELASRNVDVIVTWASAPVLAAKRTTTTIPIVFAAQMDPVGAGVVASLAHPGGNITGMSIQQTDTAGKRIELLREIVPKLARLAVIANAGAPGAMLEMQEVVKTARSLGLEAIPIKVRQAVEIFSSIESLKNRADALYVATDPLVFNNRVKINTMARAKLLPTIYGSRDYADAGALMSYGPNWADLFRHAAEQVDKVLRGTKPADIPVEQPTKFDLVINATTAKALGIDLPMSLIARADEVIE